MPAPAAKARFESRHFTGHPAATQSKLDACLASDPAHLVPNSRGPAVEVVQSALAKVAAQIDPRIPVIRDPAGEFKGSTRDAVLAYKTLRDIRIPPRQVDDIVGRRTISLLDTEMLALEGKGVTPPAPAPPSTVKDVVVQILGFGGRNSSHQGEQQGGNLLRQDIMSDAYRAKKNRSLETIVFTGGQSPNPVARIASMVRGAIMGSGSAVGLVCLTGESAGGKNVVELANLLANFPPVIPLAYVGLSDAAFFDADAIFPPNADGSNLEIRAPFFAAGETVNIFQSAGNGTEISFRLARRIWSGRMPNKEVHGKVRNFRQNRDLTAEGLAVARGDRTDFESLHASAASLANEVHKARIRALLATA